MIPHRTTERNSSSWKKKFKKIYTLTDKGKEEFKNKKDLLKPRIEESLRVFEIIYNDIY